MTESYSPRRSDDKMTYKDASHEHTPSAGAPLDVNDGGRFHLIPWEILRFLFPSPATSAAYSSPVQFVWGGSVSFSPTSGPRAT